ncbi:MAG: BamA/TamA family outer membrane protein [Candidatus Omnitrophica bacterium]|nr:BamA/TamA family outer membrane protein [Candidatus Omnitrophota bacterium]
MVNTAALSLCRRVCVSLVLFLCAPVWADEPQAERIGESAALEHQAGRVKLKGSGKIWGDVVRLKGGAEVRRLFNSPLFFAGETRFDREERLPYDLTHWGGHVGLGWVFNDSTSLLAKYRLDSYKVFNTGPNVDPAFLAVAGRNQVTALGLVLRIDSRDDEFYPTSGVKAKVEGELALEPLGGDYDFGRLHADAAVYVTRLEKVTFVERVRVGWVENFGDTDGVPFFERYFAGGPSTVRGHRSRWLTPRGLEQQFVGGEILVVNNLEARRPIFETLFDRRLSAALFFDAGRAYRRFSDLGDFGYGVGGGLRYVVKLGPLQGVLRTDYAFSLDDEGDDASSKLHVTFGMPF